MPGHMDDSGPYVSSENNVEEFSDVSGLPREEAHRLVHANDPVLHVDAAIFGASGMIREELRYSFGEIWRIHFVFQVVPGPVPRCEE